MSDINLDKVIATIGKELEPNSRGMDVFTRTTFQEMVKDVTDSIVRVNTVNALTTCYNNAQDESDRSFFKKAINEALGGTGNIQ